MEVYKRVATLLMPVPLDQLKKIERMMVGKYGKDIRVSQDGEYLVFEANWPITETVFDS